MPTDPLPMGTNATKISNGMRRVTLKDVASQAGVSFPSVSAVLNGGQGRHVAKETRQRILAAAEELGYRPNLSAQSMRSQRSMQVGVLLRNNSRVQPHEILSHPLAWDMVIGISEGLEEAGYMMSLVRLSDVDPDRHYQPTAFQGYLLDGLIVVADVPAASPERLSELVPHCLWLDGSVWMENGCIRRDEEHAGQQTASAVVEAGYQQVVLLSSSREGEHYSAQARVNGVKTELNAAGVNCLELNISQGLPDIDELQKLLRPEVALIAPGAYTTYELGRGFMNRRLVPGVDFGFACCESGFQGSATNWKEVAHTDFDRVAMGQMAARQWIEMSQGKTVPSRLIRGEWCPGPTLPPCPAS